MKSRVFNIMQYEKHPETKETLITLNQIKIALAHKTIKEWAYIIHDKDTYNATDEEQFCHKEGNTKPKHFHIVCRTDVNIETSIIARWFGISENFVDCPKGHGAFLDCVEYLTHSSVKQKALGKYQYEEKEVVANFNWVEKLEKRKKVPAELQGLSNRDLIRYRVMYEGMTLIQAVEYDKINYMNDYDYLKKCRMNYIHRSPAPKVRLNFYVCGDGGIGKGLMCRALARSLCPDLTEDDEIFFKVGSKGSPFEGYDGQPVIIWDDRRAVDLLVELNGRGNVFNIFDTHPTKQRQNVKYGSISLTNEFNIVNSVEPYEDFLNGLSGEYTNKNGERFTSEDKNQSYRRFPFILPIYENDFDLLVNKGFKNNNKEYGDYNTYHRIRGNIQKIEVLCCNNEPLKKELEKKTVEQVIKEVEEIKKQYEEKTYTKEKEDEIRDMFKDYGIMSGSAESIVVKTKDGFIEVEPTEKEKKVFE